MSSPEVPSILEIRQHAYEYFGIYPCLWQCRVVQAILRGDRDIISIAGTGSGKTYTFWIPLLFRKDGIQLIVTPLNILGDQSVLQLGKSKISAISTQGGRADHKDYMVRVLSFSLPFLSSLCVACIFSQDIRAGMYRVIVVSPEELKKRDGELVKLFKHEPFSDRVISVVWDEAHCVGAKSWGSFRDAYKDLDFLRHIIPTRIPYYITSATLDDLSLIEVSETLHLRPNPYSFVRSTDRPNIAITVRKIQHPLHTFHDLDFLIPKDWAPGQALPKFIVFFDNISESVKATKALRSRMHPDLQLRITWFNSDMTPDFRRTRQEDFEAGGLYGIHATDSFGMVCNDSCYVA